MRGPRSATPSHAALALATLAGLGLGVGLATAARAQNYAAPDGPGVYLGDGSCANPALPCTLGAAVEDATDFAGSTLVLLWVPNEGGTAVYEVDLVGAARINGDVTFDTWRNGPVASLPGHAVLNGSAIVGVGNTLTLASTLELRVLGPGARFELRNNASVVGNGWLVLGAGTRIQLGDPSAGAPGASPQIGFLDRLRIEAGGGRVSVTDQADTDDPSTLFLQNLDVRGGTLDLGNNDLFLVGEPALVHVADDATLAGVGTFLIAVDPAALGGPPNDRAGALVVSGGGRLAMDFDKLTDAGVRIELPEVGGGGTSVNRAGALYLEGTRELHGSFRNEFAARTEFDLPTTVSGNLEIRGPGGEVFPSDGTCDTGNEAGAYLAAPVDVGGDLVLDETDDPATAGCSEGLALLADGLLGGNQVKTTIAGGFSSSGASAVSLGAAAVAHNLAVEGGFAFAASPAFDLASPSAGGESCAGNELALQGPLDPQGLFYDTDLTLPSVRVQKNDATQEVEIDAGSGLLLAASAVTLARGDLDDNGRLAPASAAPAAGLSCASCPALPRAECLRPTEVGAASLTLTDKGKLKFQWKQGDETTFELVGQPDVDTDYSFCLYDGVDGVPTLAYAASLPGGPDWKPSGSSFKYSRKSGRPDGVTKATLSTGPEGSAKVTVKGKGVPAPPLPMRQEPTVVVQLVNALGSCWEAEFANFARKNTARKFKDRGQ